MLERAQENNSMNESTQEILNQYLERYEIEERIGSGGMARVYRGKDTSLNRRVAIKVLYEHLSQEGSFRERFEREARLVAQLNHPNIVQVYEFNALKRDENDIYYMVMSYVPGQTLQDILDSYWAREQTMPHERVLEVMLDLTNALGYAHDRGMIHRDVKPANILFDEREQAILTDFGIARMAQSSVLTQEGNTVGTPVYMSPEQATGDVVDSRSDIYGLGIILYEMLTGRPPFTDDGGLSVLLKHLNSPVPSLQNRVDVEMPVDIPSLEAVVLKALAKLPDDRYQTAQEFADDLQRVFDGETVNAALPGSTRELTTGPLAAVKSSTSRDEQFISIKPGGLMRSPLLLLVGGLAVVTILLAVGLITDQNSAASAPNDTNLVESMTGAVYFTGTFDEDDRFVDYWPQGEFNLVRREINGDGFYRISSELSDTAVATPFEDTSNYDDISMQMRVLLEDSSSPASGYGLIFRYQDEDNYNVFAVDGLGRFSLWVRENGRWRELRETEQNWTENPAVQSLGAGMNLLSLEVSGNEIRAFVNGVWVANVMDDTFKDGGIGIYLASPPGGQTSILVDMYQVMETSLILGESMTGDVDGTSTPAPQ